MVKLSRPQQCIGVFQLKKLQIIVKGGGGKSEKQQLCISKIKVADWVGKTHEVTNLQVILKFKGKN